MIIIDTKNTEEAKKLIKTSKKPIIVKAQDDDFNRKILEYGKFDLLLNVEYGRRDSFRQLDSGLNDFLASLASKHNISLAIDLEELKKQDKKQKAILIARIMQNIKICRKAKTQIKLLNYEDPIAALSLLLSWGASTSQAKEALKQSF